MKERAATIFEPKVFFGLADTNNPTVEFEFAVSEEDGPTLSLALECDYADQKIEQGKYHYLIEDPVQIRKLARSLMLLADIAEDYDYDEKPVVSQFENHA